MYDLIGDIHGHADELVQLLELLGYEKSLGSYRHPERKVIFLGDFIDRGPPIRHVLEIVRPMVEGDHALAVMGNHELSALAFHTEHLHRSEVFLRRRDNKNIRQHGQTILQMPDTLLADAIDWFGTLPMWLDLDGHTYRTYALQSDDIACNLALDQTVIAAATPYPTTAKPVFVGHSWLSAQCPTVLADNVACLDFSVAKGGFLCAYRWNGEQKLSNEDFVWAR